MDRKRFLAVWVFLVGWAGLFVSFSAAQRQSKETVFSCDFESDTWYEQFGMRSNPEHVDLVSSDPSRKFEPLAGKALRIRVDRGGHYGASIMYHFKRRTGVEPEEIYFRYYLRFGDDWNPAAGGKLPGISGTYGRAGWGGRPSNGRNGWSARGQFNKQTDGKTPVGFYCYHADMKGQYGSSWIWDIEKRGYLENNRWYCIEQYAKMNTPGKNDGILRAWVDGKPAFEKTDIRMRDVDTLKIEAVWLNVYLGGKWTSKSEHHLYIDDVVIARKYIGPRKIDPAEYIFPSVDELAQQKGLPDPFVMPDGKCVRNVADWQEQRQYLKAMLAHYLYGQMPPGPTDIKVDKTASEALYEGAGIRELYTLTISRNGRSAPCRFEVTRPATIKRYPTIIKNGYVAGERRGYDAGPDAVKHGYLLCEFQRTDLAADNPDSRNTGVYPLYPEYDWRAIAVWAWGHRVVLDALDKLGLADMDKVVATGHSRGGKTALCAGIYDERIAITAPNSSGTGGTGSLIYFEPGQRPQTIGVHIGKHEHWWVPRFLQFAGAESRLPFDAHFAKALIAPRGLINCHATGDYWANPYGTELTHRAAKIVYEWLSAGDNIAMHWRKGAHAQNEQAWNALLDFADRYFFGKKATTNFNRLAYPDSTLPVTWKAPK